MKADKKKIKELMKRHTALRSELNEMKKELNECAINTIKDKRCMGESERISRYERRVHELSLMISEFELEIDELKC